MKRINHQTKALLIAVLLFYFSAGVSFGQTIHVNKLYPGIGGSTLQDNNEIRFVYPDSN